MNYVIRILEWALEREKEVCKKLTSDLFKQVLRENIDQIQRAIEIIKKHEEL
jgi:hypothetical protein